MTANFNEKMFEAMLEIACCEIEERRQTELPREEEIAHVFSDDFERKMRVLTRRYKRRLFAKKAVKISARIAVIAAFVMAAGFGVSVSNADIRNEMLNVFYEFNETHIHINFRNSTQNVSHTAPLPEGFAEISRQEDETGTMAIFSDNNGHDIVYNVFIKSDTLNISADSEGGTIRKFTENGTEYTVINALDAGKNVTILWESDTELFSLSGNVEDELLIKMTNRIQ